MATPEIYTVLVGCGHFMLQRSVPPYKDILDAVLIEVNAGETFVVPPDYGHLQINPTDGPLVFSYTVAHPLVSNYEPYWQRRGAMYYEMAAGPERFVFNSRYPRRVRLRILQAAHLRQIPFLDGKVDYHRIRACLSQLVFLTRPEEFPLDAYL
jgi:glucose-6-phosphate isomerase